MLGQMLLLFSNYPDEAREVTKFTLVFFWECSDIFTRYYQRQVCIVHLFQLILRDSWLESKQMLFLYLFGLIEYLTPAVFARCLYSQHGKFIDRKRKVVVALAIGKKEVGLVVILCHCLLLKYINNSWLFLESVNIVAHVCR